MDMLQATTFVDTTAPMSRAKQARIDIWRNEVALLSTADPDVPHRPGSPSSTDSPTSSLASSRSRSSSSINSRNLSEGSRARRLLKRIGGKLTGKTREKDAVVEEAVIRTRMYQDEQGVGATAQALLNAEDGGLAAVVVRQSEDHPRGGLKDKQERLERAARLLDHGPSPNF